MRRRASAPPTEYMTARATAAAAQRSTLARRARPASARDPAAREHAIAVVDHRGLARRRHGGLGEPGDRARGDAAGWLAGFDADLGADRGAAVADLEAGRQLGARRRQPA